MDRNAAAVAGAGFFSKRALKVNPPAVISSIGETLVGRERAASPCSPRQP
jgi:hypothetical protein